MKYTYYLFGFKEQPSLICPESVALYWVLNELCIDADDCEIVFSNNTDLSPTGKLPLLIVAEEEYLVKSAGFADIISYLTTKGQIIGPCTFNLEYLAAIQFLNNGLESATLYQLYLNKKNYTGFTRKQFSKLLYWPSWYTVPLQERSEVKSRCDRVLQIEYLPIDDEQEDTLLDTSSGREERKILESELVQSKILKLAQAKKQHNLEELKAFKHNIQYCNKLVELIEDWQTLIGKSNIEPMLLRILDIFFVANIYIQLSLPEGEIISQTLTTKISEDFVKEIQSKIDVLSNSEAIVNTREPGFLEQGNRTMSLYHKTKNLLNL